MDVILIAGTKGIHTADNVYCALIICPTYMDIMQTKPLVIPMTTARVIVETVGGRRRRRSTWLSGAFYWTRQGA